MVVQSWLTMIIIGLPLYNQCNGLKLSIQSIGWTWGFDRVTLCGI
jgi:hypothetical protein